MKKYFLIILIILSYSFPSFANLDGKSLVCKCVEGCSKDIEGIIHYEYWGYFFENEKVGEIKFYPYGNTVDSFVVDRVNYSENSDSIKWNDKTLDRVSLKLKWKARTSNMIYNCSVYSSMDNFKRRMEQIKNLLEEKFNNKLKKNKI